jgi:hypothetical protein
LDEHFKVQINQGNTVVKAAANIAETGEFKTTNDKVLSASTLKRVWTNYKGQETIEILEMVIGLVNSVQLAEMSARKPTGGSKVGFLSDDLANMVDYIWKARDT